MKKNELNPKGFEGTKGGEWGFETCSQAESRTIPINIQLARVVEIG